MLKHDADHDQFAVEYARLVDVTGKLVEFEKTIPGRAELADAIRDRALLPM